MRFSLDFAVLSLFVCTLISGIGCSPQKPQEKQTDNKHPTSHERMVQFLEKWRHESLGSDRLFGDQDLRAAEKILQRQGLADWERFCSSFIAGVSAKRLGHSKKAIAHLDSAYQLIQRIPASTKARIPGIEHRTLLELTGACLRMGETDNCVACQNSDSCIFPIQGAGVHSNTEGSKLAIECLERLLEEDENNLTAKWLLNIAHMTLGDYPEAVPQQHRLPLQQVSSENSFPRFENISSRVGLNTVSLAGGVIIDDFDADGLLDVVISDWGDAGQLRYFRNEGGGKFTERIDEAGIRGIFGGLNMIQADHDNDGDLDILVLRGGWRRPTTGFPVNSLLQNDGRAFFRDVTFDAGLADHRYPSQTAAWGDYDNDGDLDLYVGNEDFPCQLFQNNGQGHFVDRAAEAGVENGRFTKGVVWGDYNGDDFPDLYVSNYGLPALDDVLQAGSVFSTAQKGEPNRLFRNNRDGTFTDVAEELGVTRPLLSFPTWFWDFNNDGALDLFVATYDGTVDAVAAEAFGKPHRSERACLYQGDGKGRFQEVGALRNLTRHSLTMGANFGDLDNDGFLDLYLGTGHPAYEALMPKQMYLNQGGKRFVNVTTAGGFGHLQKGHAIAFADIDNDGDQDVFSNLGGAFPGDTAADALFENPGFGNHWICIRLIGNKTNRCARGARLHLEIEEDGARRSIYRWVGSGGSFGANPLRQEIGVGKATVIRSLEIHWPTSGQVQRFENVPVDQFIEIHEGDREFRSTRLRGSLTERASQRADVRNEW